MSVEDELKSLRERQHFFVKPHGIFLCHWWDEVGRLLNIIDEFKIGFFVEIGLLDGGLTAMLMSSIEYNHDLCYLGIEPASHYVNDFVQAKATRTEISHRVRFLFESAWKTETVEIVRGVVRNCGRTLIYCDGGDKPKELHLYWSVLRPGDLIACHDYSDVEGEPGREVYPSHVRDLLAVGRRRCEAELRDTRILLVEKT